MSYPWRDASVVRVRQALTLLNLALSKMRNPFKLGIPTSNLIRRLTRDGRVQITEFFSSSARRHYEFDGVIMFPNLCGPPITTEQYILRLKLSLISFSR